MEIYHPGLYIHVPFCKKKCNYCGFYSLSHYDTEMLKIYQDFLLQDIQTSLTWFQESNLYPDTLYFGGGTPSLLPIEILQAILQSLANQKIVWREVTLEVNPGTVSSEQLHQYTKLGIDRVSVGIQSLDNPVLQYLGRIHNSQQSHQCLEAVVQEFENFGVDIIYAIPEMPRSCLLETVQTLVQVYHPPHISAYCLTIEDNTPLALQNVITDENQFVAEYTWLHEYLTREGYVHYEVSNFAKPGYMSLHNSKYWDRSPYLGLGPNAHSLWHERRFSFGDWQNWQQTRLSQHYEAASSLCSEEIREENIMLGLRTIQGIADDLVQNRQEQVQRLYDLQLVTMQNHRIIPTLTGWMVLQKVIGELV